MKLTSTVYLLELALIALLVCRIIYLVFSWLKQRHKKDRTLRNVSWLEFDLFYVYAICNLLRGGTDMQLGEMGFLTVVCSAIALAASNTLYIDDSDSFCEKRMYVFLTKGALLLLVMAAF